MSAPASLTSLVARRAAAAAQPMHARLRTARNLGAASARIRALEELAVCWLVAHSIAILRVSLGAIFLGFGLLKFFPGVSPAQDLVEHTTDILTFGLIPGPMALVGVAMLECVIGLCLITGRGVRAAVYLLCVQLIGILSPVVLLAARLFDGPHGAPTLEGQYVLKDVILVGAALVIASTAGGARLTREPVDVRGTRRFTEIA
jgi:putative oxidoreductase